MYYESARLSDKERFKYQELFTELRHEVQQEVPFEDKYNQSYHIDLDEDKEVDVDLDESSAISYEEFLNIIADGRGLYD